MSHFNNRLSVCGLEKLADDYSFLHFLQEFSLSTMKQQPLKFLKHKSTVFIVFFQNWIYKAVTLFDFVAILIYATNKRICSNGGSALASWVLTLPRVGPMRSVSYSGVRTCLGRSLSLAFLSLSRVTWTSLDTLCSNVWPGRKMIFWKYHTSSRLLCGSRFQYLISRFMVLCVRSALRC